MENEGSGQKNLEYELATEKEAGIDGNGPKEDSPFADSLPLTYFLDITPTATGVRIVIGDVSNNASRVIGDVSNDTSGVIEDLTSRIDATKRRFFPAYK